MKSHDRRRLDDSILHATIVKQDVPTQDKSSIYHIFERLNTGGTRLYPQEIRACIYHGKFNDLLQQLNMTPTWRKIFGDPHSRMRDQELILRFLGLFYCYSDYSRPMNDFLNRYMGWNRELAHQDETQIKIAFVKTIDTIYDSLGKNAFRPRTTFNAAVFDSVMIGLARRLAKGEIVNKKALEEKYIKLFDDPKFVGATEEHTSDENSLKDRLEKATETFIDVP